MANHLRRKINGLKRKLKQSRQKAHTRLIDVSDGNSQNIAVAERKNLAVIVHTRQNHSSQVAFSDQVSHINQEIS